MGKIFFLLLSMILFAAEGLLIPFYHYPLLENDKEIDKLLTYKRKYPQIEFFVIVNPANGDFRSEQYNFASMIDRLHEANITILGYVYTKYAARNPEDVKKRIDAWEKFYKKWGVEGIFFDEVNSSNEAFVYYRDLCTYARKKFPLIVLNPGTTIARQYEKIADIIVVHESNVLPMGKDDINKSALLLYDIQEFNITQPLLQRFRYIYITDHNGSNPWERLSLHMDKLLQVLEEKKRLFQ
ncbi:large repetitive protein [Nitratiruptor sp. YY08-26]|nr:spherulation-specific family 4 protein [Nitratiruptor sp. YY08-13]BCD62656.1 large repetitive protein [Nitratiruptor sp. YY08-13]BCD66592.1 large repetitive protein [Nitratiruptor sp. YY08-26]